MKFTISQPTLASLLARGGAVAPKNGGNVRLIAYGDCLAIASTDGSRFAEAMADAQVETTGDCVVSAAALSALIARYPKGNEVFVELEKPTLLRVKCGRSRVAFGAQPANQFQTWGDVESESTFTVTGAQLADLFGRARVAMKNDVSALGSVYIGPADGCLRFAATDTSIAIDIKSGIASEGPSMMVPGEVIDAAVRIFKSDAEVTVQMGQRKIGFLGDGVKLAATLVAGSYPPWWDAFFRVRSETTFEFKRAEFMAALDRAVLSAESEGTYAVVVGIPAEDRNGLELKTMNTSGGESREYVSGAIKGDFKPFGFDARKAASLLGAVGGETIILEQVFVQASGGSMDDRYVVYSAEDPAFLGCLAAIRINKDMAS